jgi:SAM-dependent methyltransferase
VAATLVSEKSTADTAAYYETFSLEAGAADWRHDNARHLRIRLELARLLGAARGLRILEVGCGAGVLTSELCRYGQVTAMDLSARAIALAAELEPRATFLAGRFQEAELHGEFDLIAAFDVLEHVPPGERSDFLGRVDTLLSSRGWVILTTPHPGHTRSLHEREPDRLQIVDEPVNPQETAALASAYGLELVDYRVYDVDRPGVRQYQILAFSRQAGAALQLPVGGPLRRIAAMGGALPLRPLRQLRRLMHAARLARARRFRAAGWLLGRSQSQPGRSER